MRLAAKAQAHEIRIQDVDHSEVYAALAYHAGKRLGLNESQAAVFGDAVAYLLTGWMQAHGDSNRADRVIYEFKKAAGAPPEGGFFLKRVHLPLFPQAVKGKSHMY